MSSSFLASELASSKIQMVSIICDYELCSASVFTPRLESAPCHLLGRVRSCLSSKSQVVIAQASANDHADDGGDDDDDMLGKQAISLCDSKLHEKKIALIEITFRSTLDRSLEEEHMSWLKQELHL